VEELHQLNLDVQNLNQESLFLRRKQRRHFQKFTNTF